MGLGFTLFFIFILVPVTAVLLLTWLLTRKKLFGTVLALIWTGVFGLIILISLLQLFMGKKELDREDIYGEY